MKQQRLSLRNYLAFLVTEVSETIKQDPQSTPRSRR